MNWFSHLKILIGVIARKHSNKKEASFVRSRICTSLYERAILIIKALKIKCTSVNKHIVSQICELILKRIIKINNENKPSTKPSAKPRLIISLIFSIELNLA